MHESSIKPGKTTGIVCTVLGGTAGLWVLARLSNHLGRQQNWAPPLTEYEWITLAGAGVAALLLIVGLLRLTRPEDELPR